MALPWGLWGLFPVDTTGLGWGARHPRKFGGVPTAEQTLQGWSCPGNCVYK